MKSLLIRKNLLVLVAMTAACLIAAGALAATVELLPVAPVGSSGGGSSSSGKSGSYTQKMSIMESERLGIPAFNGEGIIDEVIQEGFIINDCTMVVAPSCRFKQLPSSTASRASFKKGSQVGWVLNKQKQIIELWLLK